MRKGRNNFRGIWLDRSIFEKNLNSNEIVVYGYLYFKSDNDTFKTDLTNKEIVDAIKIPFGTIKDVINSLRRKKFIKTTIDKKNGFTREIECLYEYEIIAK